VREVLETGTGVFARLAEACAALVIGYAIIRALLTFLVDAWRGPLEVPREAIRLTLGRSLALGLEFLLAADILKTAVAPTWDAVATLAAIAAIRTGLNFFLQRELEREQELALKRGAVEASGPPPG
jgi:uncharacterized membrane protein